MADDRPWLKLPTTQTMLLSLMANLTQRPANMLLLSSR